MITTRRFVLVLAAVICTSLFMLPRARAQWLTKADESPSYRSGAALGAHHAELGMHTMEPVEREGIGDALKWYWGQRTFGLGYIPQNALQIAEQKTQAMRAASGKGMSVQSFQPQPAWTLVGPSNIGGRVNAIAIDSANPSIVYIGAANGGVWKTTNAGANWTPLTDQMQSVSMGALAIDPNNPNIVFAGTGELPQTVDSYTGYGLLRSTDGGASWSDVGPSNVGAYSRVIVNPTHSNLVYAAAGRAGGGVLRSSDGGTSWQLLAGGLPTDVSVSDLALSMKGDVAVLYAGIVGKGVYQSMDGGDTWTKLGQLPFSQMLRVCVDVDPQDWHNVVALSISSGSEMEGLYSSNDGGASWNDIGSNISPGGPDIFNTTGNPQGWYDVYVRVDPSNFAHMLVGAISVWQTNDGGQNWEDVGRSYNGGIHPDQHEAMFAPSNTGIVFFGNDGGVYSSNDGGSSFTTQTYPLPITQFYGIGIDQTQSDVTYGGTQDNGTLTGANVSADNWGGILSGDGTFTLVDPKNPNIVYCANPGGDGQPYPSKSTNGGNAVLLNSNGNGINPSIDSLSWLNPFAADINNDIIFWGCQRLLFTTNQGASWKNCAKVFGSAAGQSTISAIDAFGGDGKTVLVGTGGGSVYITNNFTATNGAATFTDVSKGLPGRWITWVKFSPSSKTTFYVTTSGFGAGHVFKTTDNGAHWTNISSTLPDIPVNTLVMDPQNTAVLYIGTDVGVFYSPNDGAEWLPYGTGLPNTAVVFMEVHDNNPRVIRAGTHGRSIWQVPLMDDVPGIIEPAQRTVWTIGDSAGIEWRGFSGSVSLDLSFDGGTSWQSLATGVAGSAYSIPSVTYPQSENVLVRVSDATDTLVSPLFAINQQKFGDQLAIVGELPFYLYDVAYDKDDTVLWGTTLDASGKIYKIDPDQGTVLDSIPIAIVTDPNPRAGFTGIKYDPITKNLFLQQVNGTADGNWSSWIYEVTTKGAVVQTQPSPAAYGTGILVEGDTIYVADRMTQQILWSKLEDWTNWTNNPAFDLSSTRDATYGPRCLAFDPKLGQFLLSYTDFQGTSLDGSYVLFLDPVQASEVNSVAITDGEQVANIRGMEYDPRGAGNTAWITVLNSSGSSKLVKIALADGPSGAPVASFTAQPSPIAFGNVDTGTTETIHVELHNSGTADGSIKLLAIVPDSVYSLSSESYPIAIKVGDSTPVDLTFAPHFLGSRPASLVITSGSDNSQTSIPISGTAIFAAEGVSPDAATTGWSLEVSPNPARDFIDVTVNAAQSDIAEIRIFDETGREVRRVPLGMLSLGEQQTELSTTGLPSGMYFVRMTGENGEVCSARLAIQR